jgi:antitoxin (DNA-binding transcriptional repressor) of toxin-antitoxin stability system
MTTIASKTLRLDYHKIMRRAQAGESYLVTHRSNPVFYINPIPKKVVPGSREAIAATFEIAKKFSKNTTKASRYTSDMTNIEMWDQYYIDKANKYNG